MKTQQQILIDELEKGYRLSKMQVITKLGVLNVGDVIMKLRDKGHPIKTDMIKNELTGKRFAVYYLQK